ncbi:MAG: ribose 5-phosphate isomerase B [Rhodospirillaceae bacterium]|jgi:ribose 5-phosphate isomerase B|nr:ribose 5-phosphate isomerase B [Rhodospirillaceae bacterium]MBT5666296.1 ribose 5-phosphate isomerase B [Rhodospirillaceae bacterium]MBT5809182.1 ribose 5-phosphate isomerase B [Rhodospirillaceae bacterium]
MRNDVVAVASDHGGFEMKGEIVKFLEEQGCDVLDLGTDGPDSVDYPEFADAMAAAIRDGRCDRGVLFCGTGIGISMAANRHRHIRAANCRDVTEARLSRAHNNANVLALGGRTIGIEVAKDCVHVFLKTEFEGGRHARRVAKMSD